MLTEYQKKYHQINKERDRNRTKEWAKTERGKLWRRIHERERLARLRVIAMVKLGGVFCVKCGFSDIRALQFDHIQGGGGRDRKSVNSGKILQEIRDTETSKITLKYQVLCANCNWIKRYENKETRPTKYTEQRLEEHGGRNRKKKSS